MSKTSPQLTMAKYYQYDQRCLWKEQTMDEVFLKVKVQRGKGKKHWPDEWVPSSLLCHIFALRHHKYELYVPLKMQPELDKTKNTTSKYFSALSKKRSIELL